MSADVGPNNETYFEHSYLSRHWGFPLVEGADLTVRDNRVYLKTLGGLNPVDVILRRMDDTFCDPLELRSDSLLGVPGLVQAARAGHVYIANALGSGLVETPSLMAFLPGLCRHMLARSCACRRWPRGGAARTSLGLGAREPRAAGDQADLPAVRRQGRVSGRHDSGRAPAAGPAHRGAAGPVRRPGAGGPVHDAGAHAQGLQPRHVVLRVLAAWDGAGYRVMRAA